MPRPRKNKPKKKNTVPALPKFGAKCVRCDFCSYIGSENGLSKHISQSTECSQHYQDARHQLHPDIGDMDVHYTNHVRSNINPTNIAPILRGSPSPSKSARPATTVDRREDHLDDDFQTLPDDFSEGGIDFLFTTEEGLAHRQPREKDGEIEMVIIRQPNDDSAWSATSHEDEFPLQLHFQALSEDENPTDSIVNPENRGEQSILSQVVNGAFVSSVMILPPNDASLEVFLSTQETYQLKLLQLTENGNMAHYCFAAILNWAREASLDGFDFLGIVHDRSTVIHRFRGRFPDLPVCTTADIQLESLYNNTREVARVVFWSFVSIFQNLLFDREIFGHIENLNCNPGEKDRFHPFLIGPEDSIGEGITGAWYEQTINQLKNDPEYNFNDETDFCVPLEGSCDKTHVDAGGRHGVTPLTLTTSLIKSNVRNHPRAWRHLGLLPDLQKMSKAAAKLSRNSPDGRGRPVRNYHACLAVIFQELKEVMKKPVTMLIRLGDRVQLKRCFFVIMQFNLDGQEKDKWVGRYSSHHPSLGTVGHSCITPVKQCTHLGRQCTPLNQYHLQNLSWVATHSTSHDERTSALEQLHQLSQYRHYSALNGLNFGANPRGICGCLGPDCLHANREGLCSNSCGIIMSSLNNVRRSKLDTQVKRMFVQCPGQSTRGEYPRIKWSNGITHVKQLAGHEWIGVLMVTSIMANTFSARSQFKNSVKGSEETLPEGIHLTHSHVVGNRIVRITPNMDLYKQRLDDTFIPDSYANPEVKNRVQENKIIRACWGTDLDELLHDGNDTPSEDNTDDNIEQDDDDSEAAGAGEDDSILANDVDSSIVDEDEKLDDDDEDKVNENTDDDESVALLDDSRSLDSEERSDCHFDDSLEQAGDVDTAGVDVNDATLALSVPHPKKKNTVTVLKIYLTQMTLFDFSKCCVAGMPLPVKRKCVRNGMWIRWFVTLGSESMLCLQWYSVLYPGKTEMVGGCPKYTS
jgi:Plavaka transposase